jgi:hypothetical protein
MSQFKGKIEKVEVVFTMMILLVSSIFLIKISTLDLSVRRELIKLMREPSRAGIKMLRREREEQVKRY